MAGLENNKLTITARESGGGASQMSVVFKGTMILGWADMQAQPQACLRLQGIPGAYQAVQPSTPTSVQGTGDVATIAGQLAQKMNFQFENNGVDVKLSNPYLSGSYFTQLRSLMDLSGVNWVIERGTLAIWPNGKSRQSGDNNIISDKTGMVSYPSYTQYGIIVTMSFRPAVAIGTDITVKSQLTPACGKWSVVGVEHNLEALTPRGQWFTTARCSTSGVSEPPGSQE